MCHKRLVSLFVLFSLTHRSNSQHTSEEIIAYVNSHASTWTVGINPDNPALDSLRFLDPNISLLYTKDEMKIMSHRQEYVSRLPEEFNALDKWPMCRNVIARVRNQGKCQSCWAVQTASVFSDRICIGSLGRLQFHASAEDVVLLWAWKHLTDNEVVSGGEFESLEGCKPYSGELFHCMKDLPCRKWCSNSCYQRDYDTDLQKIHHVYLVSPNETQIQDEIYYNGPVVTYLDLYEDLEDYREGVYQHLYGDYIGGHFIKLVGWGMETQTKYWLAANSWGPSWGKLNGFFKILRGENHCRTEEEVRAGKTTQITFREYLLTNPEFVGSVSSNLKPWNGLALVSWTFFYTLMQILYHF
ncbi:hypothetical protein Zmor_016818 [Zophobas morio]|uniref:Peptidase C1A papain C-terminal domain-containing protein n=1 Tax=Zophobas morio TaxID=2755281 RepID=A0AA38MC02_9CUCU|nr:hypothetical protein Zmor_016818 [Zophobas morio]